MSDATSADVVVVGGGVIGLSVAWRAAAAGMKVTVCDPTPGAGASWAAAGMLAPVTEARPDEAALAEFGLASIRRWSEFASELSEESGVDPGLRREGTLQVAFDADDRRALEELLAVHRSLGLDSEWATTSRCRQLEPLLTPRVRGGIEVRGDWQVDSRAVVTGLVRAVRRRGGELREMAVRRLCHGPGGVTGVELDDGATLSATVVVVAAGAYSAVLDGLPPEACPPVRPVKGEILRLRADPAHPVLTRTVRGGVRGHPVYLVPRSHGEVVVGATMEEAGFDTTVRAGAVHELLRAAIDLVPAAAELPLVESLARLRPATPDNAPVLGTTPVPGVVMATGHHRNGMLLAPLTADALLAVIEGGPLPAVAAPFSLERFS